MYLEDTIVSADQALSCGIVNRIATDRARTKHTAAAHSSCAQRHQYLETVVARACTTDVAHAALEVACFLESHANRNKTTNEVPGHCRVQASPQHNRMDLN